MDESSLRSAFPPKSIAVMVIDADGHLFETEAVFEKYMDPGFRAGRSRRASVGSQALFSQDARQS